MNTAYIALGTNLGDKQQNLNLALQAMQKNQINIQKISNFITTKPYGNIAKEDFLNAVCLVTTNLQPTQLLKTLKTIEQQLGRITTERWGDRLIDLDILLYNDLTYTSQTLTIPHKDMLNRLFVLEPLAQIAGDNFILPQNKKTISSHIKTLKEC